MHSTDSAGSPRRYTYLLSLWQEGASWRAALRPAEGGPRLGFGDLEQLIAFLLRLQDDVSPAKATRIEMSAAGEE